MLRSVLAKPLFIKQRPLSPVSIYQPQLTSTMSIFNRITGVGATAFLYGSILMGSWANTKGIPVTQYFQDMAINTPALIYYPVKIGLASAFAYHSLNGVRHLIWDFGGMMTLDGVYKSGYITLGATALTTVLLLLQ